MGRRRQEPPAAASRHLHEILKSMHFVVLLPLVALPACTRTVDRLILGARVSTAVTPGGSKLPPTSAIWGPTCKCKIIPGPLFPPGLTEALALGVFLVQLLGLDQPVIFSSRPQAQCSFAQLSFP